MLDNHENSYVDFETRDSNNLTALQCAVIWDKPHVLSVLLKDERTGKCVTYISDCSHDNPHVLNVLLHDERTGNVLHISPIVAMTTHMSITPQNRNEDSDKIDGEDEVTFQRIIIVASWSRVLSFLKWRYDILDKRGSDWDGARSMSDLN